MEELTKTQIVLLTLMVGFVTSIATGIITVALMDQASVGVTQTVNRVVERTIERVVPEKGQGASVITKEVVIKEDSLITDAIESGSKSLVRVQKSTVAEDGSPLSYFASYGLIYSKEGLILVDKKNISEGASYRGTFHDGKSINLKLVWNKTDSSVAILKAELVEEDKDYVFNPVKLGDSEMIKLGQTIISLSGREGTSVSLGIISSIERKDTTDEEPISYVSVINTNLENTSEVYGNPAITIFGEVVGMRSNDGFKSYFIPSNSIKIDISSYTTSLKTEKTTAN